MFEVEAFAIIARSIEVLLHQRAIVRVHARENKCQRRRGAGVAAEDLECLFRPEDLSAGNIPAETSGVTEALGLSEVGFASPNRRGGQFALRDVDDRSKNFVVAGVIGDEVSDVVK